ncbi:MAG TPA: endonuclease III [Tepidisphaeraceae bacterium]|nr:endonuclease III [Tepidisphaeraceae bacterium]
MPRPRPQEMRTVQAMLRRAYGPRPWKCWGDGVSVLVDTVLSQNTSAANSDAGYRQLRRKFRSWKQVADAPVEEVERCIRVSGLSNQKAPRIQAILRRIRDERGRIDLRFLAGAPDEEAYQYLRAFPGVGPKTACCTLLFAFGKGVFPVDTHIHRIARRLGLVRSKATAEQTHEALTPVIEPTDRYEMHVLLIEHGRRTCRAINPRCGECVLLKVCPYGKQRVRAAATGGAMPRGYQCPGPLR